MNKLIGFISDHRNDNWFCLTLICITCALVMLAIPLQGIPEGYDVAQHLRFAAAYRDAILNGSFIPVWPSTDNLGFGSIGIRFYPPLADFVLAVTQIFTDDWYQSLQITSFFWMFPGCIGIYLWLKEFRPAIHGAVAAIFFAVMPYHVLQIYQFQLYSEFVALAISPFCFLFATRLVKRGNTLDLIAFTVSCSLLLLTHIPSSMIVFPSLGLYVALIIDWGSPWKTIGNFLISGVISFTATSFYLVRLVTEVSQVKHDTLEFSTGFYEYKRHFFPLFINYGSSYGLLALWVLDLSILLTLFVFVPLIICVVLRKTFRFETKLERKISVAILVTGLFSIFMLSNGSEVVWKYLPTLQKIQFPWRFTSVATLFAAVASSLAMSLILRRYRRQSRLIVYTVIGLLLCLTLFDLTQSIMMGVPLTREKYYEMVVDKLSGEGCTCWWPVWAEKNALKNTEKVTAGNRGIQIATWANDSREFTVGAGEATNIRVATFYYPNWKATVNDQPTEVTMDENGVILVPVSATVSTVRLYFVEPFIYKIALWLSLSSWTLLLFALLAYKRKLLFLEEFRLNLWHPRSGPLNYDSSLGHFNFAERGKVPSD